MLTVLTQSLPFLSGNWDETNRLPKRQPVLQRLLLMAPHLAPPARAMAPIPLTLPGYDAKQNPAGIIRRGFEGPAAGRVLLCGPSHGAADINGGSDNPAVPLIDTRRL